ncbi:MAG: Fic family protein [Nanoarchaeota archaeon]|nr:Fic family protein [Nanoarchaeota archaeon]
MYRNIRRINGKDYIYIEHSFRIGTKIKKKSLYFPKGSGFDLSSFKKLNEKVIISIAYERASHIRKTMRLSKFFSYGNQLEKIEEGRAIFQIFRKFIEKKEIREIMDEYLRKFLVNSMVMEGATITYHDATAIDEKRNFKERIPKSHIPLSATNEEIALYIQLKDAFNKLDKVHLRYAADIKKLHKIIYNEIYPFAGEFRKTHVTFGRATEKAETHHWKDVQKEIIKALNSFYKSKGKLYEFERIVSFHVDYQRVHPFQDGNSRLGRLIMAYHFLQSSYPPLLFESRKSISYRSSLAKTVNSPGKTTPILKYFYENYKHSMYKFWIPLIEKRVSQKISEIIS